MLGCRRQLPRSSQCLPWCVCPGHYSVCRGVSAPVITVSAMVCLPRTLQCLPWCVCPGHHSVCRSVFSPAITVSAVVCLPRPSQCLPWCVCPGHHSVCRGIYKQQHCEWQMSNSVETCKGYPDSLQGPY